MSDRRGHPVGLIRRAVALAVLGTLAASTAGAQRRTPYDALRDYWAARSNAASAQVDRFRFLQDSGSTHATRSLRFDIVSSDSLAPLSAEIARLADSLVRRTWVPPRPGPRARFIVHPRFVSDESAFEEAAVLPGNPARLMLSVFDPERGRVPMTPLDSARPAIGAAGAMFQRSVVEPLVKSLDPDLRAWLTDRPAHEAMTPRQWRGAWLALATFPSLPSRGCLVGELHACEIALGLATEPDPVARWYDPALRQVLGARGVPGWRGSRLSEAQRLTVEACASGTDDAACIRFLSDTALGTVHVEPGPRVLRSTLVRYAFSFPADSAARARAAYAPGLTIPDRLALASGLSFDELLRRFHQQLAERRPPPTSPGTALLWASCVWCLVFGAASLGSTRWRG